MKIDKEKALKIIYELIIFSEEIHNKEDKECWKAYDYIKEKLEIKPQANERNK